MSHSAVLLCAASWYGQHIANRHTKMVANGETPAHTPNKSGLWYVAADVVLNAIEDACQCRRASASQTLAASVACKSIGCT